MPERGGQNCTSDEVTNDNLCIVSVADAGNEVVAGGAGATVEAARDDAFQRAAANGTPLLDRPPPIVISDCHFDGPPGCRAVLLLVSSVVLAGVSAPAAGALPSCGTRVRRPPAAPTAVCPSRHVPGRWRHPRTSRGFAGAADPASSPDVRRVNRRWLGTDWPSTGTRLRPGRDDAQLVPENRAGDVTARGCSMLAGSPPMRAWSTSAAGVVVGRPPAGAGSR